MKFSSLFLIGTTFASSNVQGAYGDITASCLTSISKAQICLRTCGNDVPVGGVTSTITNLLFQCISNNENLGSCCFPADNAECATSWTESSTCLTNTLINIKDKSNEYIQCISQPGACADASMCVAQLTGGAGVVDSPNNFDVESSALQNMASNATTCSEMDTFLNNACTTVSGCCLSCSSKIAAVVQAVTNDLLLPVYHRDATALNCDSMTCPDTSTRNLEDGSTTIIMTSTGDDSDNDNGTDLATECNDVLAQDILMYNESYAIDNFFGCLTKQMGAIMSKADVQAVDEESSSSSSFFIGMPSLLSTSVIASFSIIIAFISY